MSIKAYVDELEQVQEEIKRNNKRNALLRVRVRELEASISEYLTAKGQHGLKYKGRAILVQSGEKRGTKSKKEKESSIMSLLNESGIEDPDEFYAKLIDVQKKDPVVQTKIKFTRLKGTGY